MTRYTPQWLQNGSYAGSQDRRLISALWPGPAVAGCAVSAGTGMTVNVAVGQAAVPTQNSTGSTLCTSDAVETVTLAAAPASGNNRYDLIICQPRGNDLDGGSNNDFIFTSVTGTAAASPTVPPTPPGALVLAQIYVPGGSASVTAGNITDVRPAQPLAVPPPVPADTAWTPITAFANGWANAQSAAYIKLGGVVYLRGVISPGTAATTAFTLPAGYRPNAPSANYLLSAGGNAVNTATITNAGAVSIAVAANAWLSPIVFPTI
jgi:hypothetical protein